MGFAFRLTGSRPDAEDIVQETFIAAFSGRTGFQGRSTLLAWLLGISTRTWRDKQRHRAVETIELNEDEMDRSRATVSVATPITLEKTVLDNLCLQTALLSLSDLERLSILLIVSQGLTYKEAATVTNEPIGTVKWRVSAALSKLRLAMTSMDDQSTGIGG
jgi:RNA polymerase sigma-70 factor (ECF subfamily)